MAFSGRLSDAQWARIAPHVPRRKRNPRGGRPPADDRKCFEGILWILWTARRGRRYRRGEAGVEVASARKTAIVLGIRA